MLHTTNRNNLENPEYFDVIVLVEGSEVEIFVEPSRWFPNLDVLMVNCCGFSGVASVFEEIPSDFGDRVVPTVDQDALEERPPRDESSAWNSPNLFLFVRTFEDAFDSWILAEAINSQWSDVNWELTVQEVDEARDDARENRQGIYSAIEVLGREMYPNQGFDLPPKPTLARRLGELMNCHQWIPQDIEEWVRWVYATAGQQKSELYYPDNGLDDVNWELVQEMGLSGFLVMCDREKLLGVDFDNECVGPLAVQSEDISPSGRPMWSPDGEALLFQGKSERRDKTVSAVLKPDGTEKIINIGGPKRGTSVCDWGPSGNFVYVHGPGPQGYRMWRRSLSDNTTVPVEPETHGGVLRKVGRNTLGLGSSNNRTQAFQLQDVTLEEQKDLENWHPLAKCHESTAIAWDYYRDSGFFFALAEPLVKGGGGCPMRVFTGELDPDGLEIVNAQEVVKPLRRVMSLCWSPTSCFIIVTSVYEGRVYLVDLETGCLNPLVQGTYRVSGRSWLPSRPSEWRIAH